MMPAYVCMHPTNVKYDGVTKQGPDVAHQTTYYIGCVWILIKRQETRQDLGSIARARSFTFVDKGEPSTQC